MSKRLPAILTTLALAGVAVFGLATSASATNGTDDYPFKNQNTAQTDPWGFNYRQCVSFIAWRENGSVNATSFMNEYAPGQMWGNASNWMSAAQSQGITVSNTPVVGAVAQWGSGQTTSWTTTTVSGNTKSWVNHTFTASSSGHVAYVDSINSDGTVNVEQYNADVPLGYSQGTVAYENAGDTSAVSGAPHFLYINVSGAGQTPTPSPSPSSSSNPTPSPRLTQSSAGGTVTLTLSTLPSYAGHTVYFYRRSGISNKVAPYGTGVINSEGIAIRVFKASVGQILAIYGVNTGAPKASAYSNTISFKVD